MLLYRFLLGLYHMAIRIAARFNPKAAQWVSGRRDILRRIAAALPAGERRIWMHCASLGEFEQGRPVLELVRQQYPGYKIVLTFFSPSGYEVRKDYAGADHIFYLPLDGKHTATQFLDAVRPAVVLFVKYEFWYFYLSEIRRRQIPCLLISAAFRKEQAFFKWYGGFFRGMLHSFSDILVQDEGSLQLLRSIGITAEVAVAGDTRYDRVLEIAANAKVFPDVAAFKGNNRLLIGGSTWPADEQALKAVLDALPQGWKVVLAPHEIDEAHLAQVMQLFGADAIRYSHFQQASGNGKRVLVIDNIGMLSSLYRYGEIAFIGGGFNKGGIHNVLEPAVFGLPIVIGPVYKKFVEAVALAKLGFVFPVADAGAAAAKVRQLADDAALRGELCEGLRAFTRAQSGATIRIGKILSAYL